MQETCFHSGEFHSEEVTFDVQCIHSFIYLFIYLVLRPFQDYFSSYETGKSVGGAKTGETREKPPGTPQAECLACLACAPCGARTHARHSGETIGKTCS